MALGRAVLTTMTNKKIPLRYGIFYFIEKRVEVPSAKILLFAGYHNAEKVVQDSDEPTDDEGSNCFKAREWVP